MKRIIICFIIHVCLCTCVPANAQVGISIFQPQPFQVKPSDMFRASVVNTSGSALRVYFAGTIVNTKNGSMMVEGKSQPVEVPVGSSSFSESMLAPDYRFGSQVLEQTGNLPYGNYEICLKMYVLSDNEEKGASCIGTEVTPLSPPLLINPENESVISEPHPLLVWLAPTPVNSSMKILYDLKLVELMQNQTAYDAIQRNFALLDQRDIRFTNLQYPATAMGLEENKTYAWKVLAKTADGVLIGETEVWTFRYQPPKPRVPGVLPAEAYAKLKPTLDGGFYQLYNNRLFVQYIESYNKENLNFKILNSANTEVKNNCGIVLSKEHGENLYMLDISKCASMKRGFYTLEVYNDKGNVSKLKFKY